MADPHNDTPDWLVKELYESINYGNDPKMIEQCFQPMFTNNHEVLLSRSERRSSTSKSTKERHEKKLIHRSSKGKERAEDPPIETGLPSPDDSLFVPETSAPVLTTFTSPEWYMKINLSGPNYKIWTRTRNTQAEQSLQIMKDCITRCEKSSARQLPKIFGELWREIHKAEVRLRGIDGMLLRKNVMLGPGDQGKFPARSGLVATRRSRYVFSKEVFLFQFLEAS